MHCSLGITLDKLRLKNMSVRMIRNSWWVDFRFDHIRLRKRSPENTRSGALMYESVLRSRLARGEHMSQLLIKSGRDFNDYSKEWFRAYVKTNNRASVQKEKFTTLRIHLVPSFGHLPLKDITNKLIEEYKLAKLESGLSPKTINNHISILRTCLSYAVEWGELEKLPRVKQLKCKPMVINFLNEDECQQVLTGKNELLMRDMVLLALRTGMRIGELIALTWQDIDFENKLINIQRSIVDGKIGVPKSNRIRFIPLTNEMTSLFKNRPKFGPYVFHNNSGKPLTDHQVYGGLKRLCKETGVREFGWHALRHTFASQLVSKNVSLHTVQKLMGHSTITMTEHYAHLAPSSLQDAVKLLETPTQNSSLSIFSI